jgi:hypothetical protein
MKICDHGEAVINLKDISSFRKRKFWSENSHEKFSYLLLLCEVSCEKYRLALYSLRELDTVFFVW